MVSRRMLADLANDVKLRNVDAADFDVIAAITNEYIVRTAIHFGTQPVTGDEDDEEEETWQVQNASFR